MLAIVVSLVLGSSKGDGLSLPAGILGWAPARGPTSSYLLVEGVPSTALADGRDGKRYHASEAQRMFFRFLARFV